mmetsp:Transcript_52462/g.125580  ORF Transcript_52462/g.125580 Transcript_52462/m.125580 type:complete len:215 (+) Transcript_52462:262-906(+)
MRPDLRRTRGRHCAQALVSPVVGRFLSTFRALAGRHCCWTFAFCCSCSGTRTVEPWQRGERCAPARCACMGQCGQLRPSERAPREEGHASGRGRFQGQLGSGQRQSERLGAQSSKASSPGVSCHRRVLPKIGLSASRALAVLAGQIQVRHAELDPHGRGGPQRLGEAAELVGANSFRSTQCQYAGQGCSPLCQQSHIMANRTSDGSSAGPSKRL